MYVLIVVNEDNDEDDKGGRHGLGEDGDNARDHRGDRRGGASVDAGGGAGGKAAGRELFCGLIRANGEHCCQPEVTRPPNALVKSLAPATSSPLLLMASMLTWMPMRTLSRRCDAPPS